MFVAFEAAFGLLAVCLFPGADFVVKGGKGRIRGWAENEAAIFKALIAYVIRAEKRTSQSRSPRMLVLKSVLALKRDVLKAKLADTWMNQQARSTPV